MFAFKWPVVPSSNSPSLSSVIILLNKSVLLLDDNKLLSQNFLLTASFLSMDGCKFSIVYFFSYQYYRYLLRIIDGLL